MNRILLPLSKLTVTVLACLLIMMTIDPLSAFAQDVHPGELEFRRQAVRRMIFDRSQDIQLAGLWPAKIVGLDVMHPPVGEQINNPSLTIKDGRLRISSPERASVTRWVGGFNPFAVYDVAVHKFNGSGQVGLMFRDTDAENRITATLIVNNGKYRAIRWVVMKDGEEIDRQDFSIPEALISNAPIRLRVQMLAVGANLFIERHNVSTLIGRMDFVKHFDLRRKNLMRRFEFCLHSSIEAGQSIYIDEATAALSPGIGQADIRNVTYENGSPIFKDGRLWLLMTVRGGGLAHPMQGVYSLNPSVFDIRFEGIILYDRGDGLLRNDLASSIIYDRNAQQWRGFTVGFSSYGDPTKKEKKQILAVQSSKEPLQGLSIMKAKPVILPNSSEDPQVIYDQEAQKWRVLACAKGGAGFPATLYESDKWDGPYKIIAGPVDKNSTGCLLQKFGSKYYVLFGSKDRKVDIYTYPDLKPAGELNMHLPPWDDQSGTRVWPNVIPLPEGYPARYMALMMDRLNFPGMKGGNWTYGAMYLYHAHPVNDTQDYEYK
ncbi:hypothetical protein ACFL6U_01185 [Planctomycetota bacterium]